MQCIFSNRLYFILMLMPRMRVMMCMPPYPLSTTVHAIDFLLGDCNIRRRRAPVWHQRCSQAKRRQCGNRQGRHRRARQRFMILSRHTRRIRGTPRRCNNLRTQRTRRRARKAAVPRMLHPMNNRRLAMMAVRHRFQLSLLRRVSGCAPSSTARDESG
jgi:hypothetical protein